MPTGPLNSVTNILLMISFLLIWFFANGGLGYILKTHSSSNTALNKTRNKSVKPVSLSNVFTKAGPGRFCRSLL